jgi:Holliday junction resolvase RusA-like endonuclease
MEKNKSIFLVGNVPSSKNSKQWTGKFLVNSKTVQNYLKTHEKQYLDLKDDFLELIKDKEFPLKIGFYFVRDSRRRADHINLAQLPCDLMVKHGWIPDDDMSHLIPVFLGYEVDKENAGVGICIL